MLPQLLGLGLVLAAAIAFDDPPRRRRSRPRTTNRLSVSAKRRLLKAATAAEKRVCRQLGKAHIGGPGKPDCEGQVENKHWSTPVHAGVVRAEAKKGRKKLSVTKAGFTSGAVKSAPEAGIELMDLRPKRKRK